MKRPQGTELTAKAIRLTRAVERYERGELTEQERLEVEPVVHDLGYSSLDEYIERTRFRYDRWLFAIIIHTENLDGNHSEELDTNCIACRDEWEALAFLDDTE